MKKILSLLLVCLIAFPAFAETAMTLEELELMIGIDIDATNASDLITYLTALDKLVKPYDQYRAKLLNSIAQKGETEWAQTYLESKENVPELFDLSYEELINLKNDINLAMWLSDKWQEVTVPQGVWKVGEDIPAGHWTVKCASGARSSTIEWGEKLSDTGDSIAWSGRYSLYNHIYNPLNYTNPDQYLYEYSFEVLNGDYILIEDGSVIFMPYTGKPSLGFK